MEIPPGTDLTKVPLLPNPDGSPPNFDNPVSLKATTFSVTIILVATSSVLVLLRVKAHSKIYKGLALDDCFCIASWALTTVYSAVVMSSTSTARHIWDVPLSAIDESWVKQSAVLGTIYGPAMWFAKTAILTMYLRLFSVKTWMKWCCYCGIGFLFCAYWSLVPVSAIYNFPHGDEHWDLSLSIDSQPAQVPFVVMGLISVVSDLYILVLPFPILLTLQVSRKRRVGLCLVFLTAIIGIVSSCLVFYFRIVLWRNDTDDSTWNVAASYLTVAVEMNVAVIVSCTPAAAATWNLMLQDSKLLSSLRSLFNSSKNLVGDSSGSNASKIKHTEPAPVSTTYLISLESINTRGGDIV
ncbi:hypothetical protein F4813DRAFT_242352 [Daldinia decipiens]|uniref:uncharacterized protein n=1 Tax=Daldinia decipiens TaxID=326647 RepID=UPI0020C443B4|nr:uncharacterized protein F4813DRAFT_242352 [Daldinia decipiens]KAI1653885.1 hypothetical protein F4813DRAFT_242352 [Daldinia decipiens]